MPTRGKAILGASLLVGLVMMFILFRMATAPSYVTVINGVDPSDTAKATAALDEAGIAYKLENNGTAVSVVSDSESQAKVALSSTGLASGGSSKPGMELLDEQKLGASDFQQKINYQRALEGEIAKNIGSINGISSATVQLSLPDDKLFADESSPPTASVLLGAPANGLDPQQVRGIASMVAGSVEGLKDENVTVTTTTGELIWPLGEGGQAGGTGGSTTKIAAENRYATELQSKLNAMLIRTIGPDKAYIEARPTLNVDEIKREELKYGTRGTALARKEETEELQSEGETAGAAGARPNIEGVAADANGSSSDYNREMREENFGVDKTIERTTVAPGAVEKLDVALVLDADIPEAQVTEIEAAVASAAGIDQERGDTLAVSQVPFDQPETEEAKGAPVPPQAVGMAKWVGLGIAGALFLFFVTRALRKRENEALGDARWLTEIDEPRPLAALTAGGHEMDSNGLPEAAPPSAARTQVGEMVDKEPEKVAQQLRAWMSEES
ncbi:MAG: flagellar M-ring protein FliF [Solirubrobacteraceae bacterium]|nr:flagellar M-ring protein FliF [Solirubrobacteraceae bacterium]